MESLNNLSMSDEVKRLRRLRRKALEVRAVAIYLNAAVPEDRIFRIYERAALVNWRIARIATGKLRSHPYRNYQKDPGFFESRLGLVRAYLKAALATIVGRGMRLFLEEISSASRELDDARALTWSAELSDAFGRAQERMRSVIDEVRREVGDSADESAELLRARGEASPNLSVSPYLAL